MATDNGSKPKRHLLNLPAEIRLLIYEHLFHGIEYRSFLAQLTYAPQHWHWVAHDEDGPRRRAFAILRVSRLVHTETSLLPYKLGTFKFNTAVAISLFLRACSPAQIAAVRKVQFTVAYARNQTFAKGAEQGRLCAETWSGFLGVEDLQVIIHMFATKAEKRRRIVEDISGQYTEYGKKKLAQFLVVLKDEVHKRMARVQKFRLKTVLEGEEGTAYVKDMEERMEALTLQSR